VKIYANSHYVTPRPTLIQAIAGIKLELRQRLDELNRMGRLLEAQLPVASIISRSNSVRCSSRCASRICRPSCRRR